MAYIEKSVYNLRELIIKQIKMLSSVMNYFKDIKIAVASTGYVDLSIAKMLNPIISNFTYLNHL